MKTYSQKGNILLILLLLFCAIFIFISGAMQSYFSGNSKTTLKYEDTIKEKSPEPFFDPTPAPDDNQQVLVRISTTNQKELLRLNNESNMSSRFSFGVMNNVIYYVFGSDLFSYNLLTLQSNKIYSLNDQSYSSSFGFTDKTGNVYLTVSDQRDGVEDNRLDRLIRIDPQTKNATEIYQERPGHFSSLRYLDDYLDTKIIYSFGGDGCGGEGEIKTLQNGQVRHFLKIGSGCVSAPNLIGYDKESGSVLLVEGEYDSSGRSAYYITRVYKKSIVDGSEHALFSIENYRSYNRFFSNQKGTLLYLFSEDHFLRLDLIKGTMHSFPIEEERLKSAPFIHAVDDCLLFNMYTNDEQSFYKWCAETGVKQEYKLGPLHRNRFIVHGIIEGDLILSYTD